MSYVNASKKCIWKLIQEFSLIKKKSDIFSLEIDTVCVERCFLKFYFEECCETVINNPLTYIAVGTAAE